jgi:hypothetical protein
MVNPKPNVVQAWLELIGTPQRANVLLGAANSPWPECPSQVLLGERVSQTAYANPRYRPALDAWDTGLVTRRDVLGWAKYVASGAYKGPYFFYTYIPLRSDNSPAVPQVNDLQVA